MAKKNKNNHQNKVENASEGNQGVFDIQNEEAVETPDVLPENEAMVDKEENLKEQDKTIKTEVKKIMSNVDNHKVYVGGLVFPSGKAVAVDDTSFVMYEDAIHKALDRGYIKYVD